MQKNIDELTYHMEHCDHSAVVGAARKVSTIYDRYDEIKKNILDKFPVGLSNSIS